MTIYKNRKGFTLIEAIAVLIVLGILSAVVISRITSTTDVSIKAQAEAMKSHIRYVQMRAMNMTSSDPNCAASFGMVMSGGSYFMFRDCITTSKVVLPGAESSSGVTLLDGMTVTSATFSFDNWGRPYPTANGTGTSSDIPLSLSGEPITITRNTGYVP